MVKAFNLTVQTSRKVCPHLAKPNVHELYLRSAITDSLTEEDERVEEVVLEGVPPRPEGLLRLGAAEDLQSRPTSGKKLEMMDQQKKF